ncbi:hypothetical protein F4774DRAFT_74073 [Daldinia eschscholtzii]|nr:hypothetical protein F4774DRAFT_74073 [Daldinia eschscholtzii]
MRLMFGNPLKKEDARKAIRNLKQTKRASEYATKFKRLAAVAQLPEDAQFDYFYEGLATWVKDEISKEGRPKHINEYIERAIIHDKRSYERFQEKRTKRTTFTRTKREPKEASLSAVKADKPKRDMSKIKCYNCNKMGHISRNCKAPRKQPKVPEGRPESKTIGAVSLGAFNIQFAHSIENYVTLNNYCWQSDLHKCYYWDCPRHSNDDKRERGTRFMGQQIPSSTNTERGWDTDEECPWGIPNCIKSWCDHQPEEKAPKETIEDILRKRFQTLSMQIYYEEDPEKRRSLRDQISQDSELLQEWNTKMSWTEEEWPFYEPNEMQQWIMEKENYDPQLLDPRHGWADENEGILIQQRIAVREERQNREFYVLPMNPWGATVPPITNPTQL